MELAEGGNLNERIHHPHKRRLELLEALQTCREIAEGLAHLHPLVIHGDLKPQNVLLDRQVGVVSGCRGMCCVGTWRCGAMSGGFRV